jgi:hypothetical protein
MRRVTIGTLTALATVAIEWAMTWQHAADHAHPGVVHLRGGADPDSDQMTRRTGAQ